MVFDPQNPLVSILIPTYNREALIGEAIESALNQTYQNIELIIVDNASTDKTIQVIESYQKKDQRIKLFQNEKNLGPVLNWERCLENALGEYSKILWSDDLIAPEFLESCLSLFNIEKNLAFVFTKVRIGSNPLDKNIAECYDYFGKTGIFNASKFVDGIIANKALPVSPGCAIFRTEILKKSFIKTNELFDNKYLQNGAGPDLLMFLMASRIGDKIGYVNEALSFFRSHPSSISILEESNLFVFYCKAVIWFIYTQINKDLANAHYLRIKKSLRDNKKITESFELKPEFVRNNLMVIFYGYDLKIAFFKRKIFRLGVKALCCLMSKDKRRKIRKKLL